MLQRNMLSRLWSILVPVFYGCAGLSNEIFNLPPPGILKNLSNQAIMTKKNKKKKIHTNRKYTCVDSFIFLK